LRGTGKSEPKNRGKANRRTREKRTVEPKNRRISNVEGMYSVDFIKRKQPMAEEKKDKAYDLEERLIDLAVFVTSTRTAKKVKK